MYTVGYEIKCLMYFYSMLPVIIKFLFILQCWSALKTNSMRCGVVKFHLNVCNSIVIFDWLVEIEVLQKVAFKNQTNQSSCIAVQHLAPKAAGTNSEDDWTLTVYFPVEH